VTPPNPQALHTHLSGLFVDLPAAECAALVGLARPLNLVRDAPLLRVGTRWSEVFWLEGGALRLYFLDAEGGESNKNFYTEGAMLWPITPTLQAEPVGFFIAALEPSVVWRLPLADWQSALAALPSWAELQTKTLGRLLDDKMRREQTFLQLSARARYEQLLLTHPEWSQRLALRHLASYLGMTDVSLSRLRAELGLITR
jgi:CRP-like cAMP-binding protein